MGTERSKTMPMVAARATGTKGARRMSSMEVGVFAIGGRQGPFGRLQHGRLSRKRPNGPYPFLAHSYFFGSVPMARFLSFSFCSGVNTLTISARCLP